MKFWIYLTTLFFCSTLIGYPTRSHVKTSIIIPCHATHITYLDNLLFCYANQTMLPDEVVVSVSSCDTSSEELIEKLRNKSWPFSLNILTTRAKQLAGKNRNNACDHALGDLFICQDADDIPHRQRVEIIAQLHKKTHFDHLVHSYFFSRAKDMDDQTILTMNKTIYRLDMIKCQPITSSNLGSVQKAMSRMMIPILNGAPIYTRAVFQKVRWREDIGLAEDLSFNQKVYSLFKNNLIADAKLYCYCNWASTHSQK